MPLRSGAQQGYITPEIHNISPSYVEITQCQEGHAERYLRIKVFGFNAPEAVNIRAAFHLTS